MKTTAIKIIVLSLLTVSCQQFHTTAQYTYHPPDEISDGLVTGSIYDMNVDVEAIEKAVDQIITGRYAEVHSMLIFKDNHLVLEEYFQGHAWKWDAPGHHGDWVQWEQTR